VRKLILLLLFIPLLSFGQGKRYNFEDEKLIHDLNYSLVTYDGKQIDEGVLFEADRLEIHFKAGADSHYIKCDLGDMKFEGLLYGVGDIPSGSNADKCLDCEYVSGLYLLYDEAYYKNGNLYMKAEHKNGQYTSYEKFNESGVLEEKLINGVISNYKYSNNSKLNESRTVKKGGDLNNPSKDYPVYIKRYYENGKLEEEGNAIGYPGDVWTYIRAGTWKYYYPDGTVSILKYENGRSIYADEIELMMKVIDDGKENKQRIKEYYNEEDVYDDGEMFYLKSTNELLNGVLLKNYPGGIRQAEFTIENGIFNGMTTSYYLDGSLKMKGFYKNGKQNDTWFHYYGSDKIKRVIQYNDNGKMIGYSDYRNDLENTKKHFVNTTDPNSNKIKMFDSDENLISKGTSNAKNERHGSWEYFDKDGNKLRSGGYLNGKKNGPWMEYDSKKIGEFNIKFYKDGKVFQY